MIQKQTNGLESIFAGGGQMGILMRCFDWESTPLGPGQKWPQSLHTAVSILLNFHYPAAIYWSCKFICLYNDAYIPFVGDKHPQTLGQTITRTQPQLWSQIGPVLQKVMETKQGVWCENIPLSVVNSSSDRFSIDADFSCAPIMDENGQVGGIFVCCSQKIRTVKNCPPRGAIARRRLKTIQKLAAKGTQAKTLSDTCRLLMESLASNFVDIPFALLYLIEQNQKARLVEKTSCQLEPTADIEVIDVTKEDKIWYFDKVLQTGQPLTKDYLPECLYTHPLLPEESRYANITKAKKVEKAVVLPITQPAVRQPQGFLVVGASRKQAADKATQAFLTSVAAEISNAIANAHLWEKAAQLRQPATACQPQLQVLGATIGDKIDSILNSITDAFVALDKDWQILYINQKAAAKNGQTPEEIIGKNHWQHWHWLAGTQVEQEYRRAVAEQVPVHFETPCQPFNTWLEIRAYPCKGGLNVFLCDITERKQMEKLLKESEQRWRLAVEETGLGVWDFDIASGEIICSHGSQNMLGLTAAADVKITYETFLNAVHPNDRDRIAQALQQAIAHSTSSTNTQENNYNVEFRTIWADGTVHWLASKGRVYCDEYGKPTRMTGVTLDITAPKQAEQALRQSKAHLAMAEKVAQVGSWEFDLKSQKITWSETTFHHWGLDPAQGEPSYDELLKRVYPEDREILQQAVERAIAQGIPYAFDMRIVRPDGSIRYLDFRGEPVFDEHGQVVVKLIGISFDVTERKQTEEALRLWEARFRLAVENLPEAFMLYDAQRRFQFVNAKVLQLSSKTLEEFIGRRDEDVFPAEVTSAYLPLLLKAVETGKLQTGECTIPLFKCQKSEAIVFNVKYVPLLDKQGKIQQILALTHDITNSKRAEEALRQREQQFRALVENSPDLISRFDRNFRLQYINPRVELEMGIPVKEWLGKTLLELGYPEALVNPWHQALQKVFDTKQELVYDSEFPTATGIKYWSSRLVPELAEDGSVETVLSVCRDITSCRQAELELQQAKEAAQTASRIKDEFLAILSHELRSPLTPILAWAQILRLKKFDAATTEYALETIERNAKLQTQLIEDLLDVSCIIQGKMSLNIKSVNLVFVVQAALETIRSAAQAKAIEIQTFLDYTPYKIKGDPSRLQQIVWNLLSNAVKFTPEGGKITLKLEYFDRYAQIQVSDTGKGISPEFLPYVFKRFSQESRSTNRKFGGLGLGLSIVHYLTKLHGGSVKAESPGENLGATFKVCLPLVSIEWEETDKQEQPQTQVT